MKREPVESSLLVSLGYDPDNETLDIEFRAGWVYRYFEIVPLLYVRMMRAKSKDLFFDTAIRHTKRFRQLS